jgi:hypothetical protein
LPRGYPREIIYCTYNIIYIMLSEIYIDVL